MKFKPGDTVIWDENNFNPKFWDNLPEEDRIKYYGPLGYGQEKPVLFTFICEHSPQLGHCVLINMHTQEVETMRHTSEFRLATDEEC